MKIQQANQDWNTELTCFKGLFGNHSDALEGCTGSPCPTFFIRLRCMFQGPYSLGIANRHLCLKEIPYFLGIHGRNQILHAPGCDNDGALSDEINSAQRRDRYAGGFQVS